MIHDTLEGSCLPIYAVEDPFGGALGVSSTTTPSGTFLASQRACVRVPNVRLGGSHDPPAVCKRRGPLQMYAGPVPTSALWACTGPGVKRLYCRLGNSR